MIKYIIFLLLSLPLCLFSLTLTVATDGSGQFNTIQNAVNAAQNGDIIQVYPGTYHENINLNGKSLTLQSLYATTNDTLYIHQTKISGVCSASAIYAENCYQVTINGFTIMNNEAGEEIYYNNGGGGICIVKSNSIIKNNIITQSLVGTGGGGICLANYAYDPIHVILENNQIYNNKAFQAGGGLIIADNVLVTFSENRKNSIFNNSAWGGKDITLSNPENDVHIILDRCSNIMESPDQYFIFHNFPIPGLEHDINVEIDIERATLPLLNHDLYVAPWGSDSNSGLSPESPLKSIDLATKMIAPDSLNPKTVFLTEGTYSRSLNQQNFPISVKRDTRFKGAGMNICILDDENVFLPLGAVLRCGEIKISDMSIINSGANSSTTQGFGTNAHKVHIENMLFKNGRVNGINGIHVGRSEYAFAKNIFVENSIGNGIAISIIFEVNKNVVVENVSENNATTIGESGGQTGIYFRFNNNILLNNCRISNGHSTEPSLFQVICDQQSDDFEAGEVYLNNVLIFNNQTSPGFWNTSLVEIWDYYNEVTMNNWTVANNFGNNKGVNIGGLGATLNNCIFYNPELTYEMEIGCENIPHIPVYLNHSLLYGGLDRVKFYSDQHTLYLNNVLTGEPLFLGQVTDSLTVDMPDYYRLSANSPCIDSGTPDINGLNLPEGDISGHQRVWNNRIDMGCFEYDAPLPVGDQTVPVLNDYNLKNFPNPFNLNKNIATIICFDYPEKAKSDPEIEIFNIKGQKVRTLKTGPSLRDLEIQAGISNSISNHRNYSVSWDAKDENHQKVASGVYFYRAKVDGKIIQTRKMMVIK
ncbi:MAG TPA: pectinesterase family protein [Candidatus Cloacimonadota bacterium]|nr:pectinesterase family protein [Candidatus Cloacimonadota bacterium]